MAASGVGVNTGADSTTGVGAAAGAKTAAVTGATGVGAAAGAMGAVTGVPVNTCVGATVGVAAGAAGAAAVTGVSVNTCVGATGVGVAAGAAGAGANTGACVTTAGAASAVGCSSSERSSVDFRCMQAKYALVLGVCCVLSKPWEGSAESAACSGDLLVCTGSGVSSSIRSVSSRVAWGGGSVVTGTFCGVAMACIWAMLMPPALAEAPALSLDQIGANSYRQIGLHSKTKISSRLKIETIHEN